MSQVIVYVEGPSDKAAMEVLLGPLIESRRQRGVAIDFVPAPRGDSKKSLLLKVPGKAANILLNRAETFVVVLPDLYPKNRGFPHETAAELTEGLESRFRSAVEKKASDQVATLAGRFEAFCFKHDLEALLLASHEALAAYLGLPQIEITWRLPVEDHDHGHPPRRVVEGLFRRHGRTYRPVVDAPLILRAADIEQTTERCPQCFRPFVEFLRTAE